MKFFITGGTGFVGSYVTRRLIASGHEVTLVSRSASRGARAASGARFVVGDTTKPGEWQEAVAGHDAAINLAGATIFRRWSEEARREILESRVLTTRNLVDALSAAPPGAVLLSASAVGYYGGQGADAVLTEASPAGSDFLAEVGTAWEAEAGRAERFGARVVLCRFGIVLGRGGGALAKMAPAFRFMVASPLGSGRQWFPWIHEEDLFSAMLFAAERPDFSGPMNCTAPHPVRNEEMSRILAEVLHRPLLLPALPGFLLRMILGEFGDVLLKGQRALPEKLLRAGFHFRFPTLREALEDLLHRVPRNRASH